MLKIIPVDSKHLYDLIGRAGSQKIIDRITGFPGPAYYFPSMHAILLLEGEFEVSSLKWLAENCISPTISTCLSDIVPYSTTEPKK